MYDIISIGDTTVDVFLRLNANLVKGEIDRQRSRISLPYGGKVPVTSVMSVNGAGNAANCAVSFARLGLKTGFYTLIGNDDRGRDIYKHLRSEGVSRKYITEDKKKGTNYSAVVEYEGDRTILAYHEEREYSLPKFHKTRWLYFSSIAGNHETFNRELVNYVETRGISLAFNPGTRQMRLGLDFLRPLLAVTEILFINKEEAEDLLSVKGIGSRGKSERHFKSLLSGLKDCGPSTVVITDGNNGSYSFDGLAYLYLKVFDVPMLQHTGCGDAYSSAFVAARVLGESSEEAMRWGTFNAASVVQHIGSQSGLLNRRQLCEMSKKEITLQPVLL